VCNCEVNNQVFPLTIIDNVCPHLHLYRVCMRNATKNFQFNGEQQSGVSQKFQSIPVPIRWHNITIGYGSDRWNKIL
jgi:hypothetical protein